MSRCYCDDPPGGHIDCPDACIGVCIVSDKGKPYMKCVCKFPKQLRGESLIKWTLNTVVKEAGLDIPADRIDYSQVGRRISFRDAATNIRVRFTLPLTERAPGRALSKSELAAVLAEKVGLTKKQSVAYLESLANLAYKNAKNTFTLPGLGKLKLKNRPARIGRNPATGKTIHIPAKKVVKFQVAKAAKDAILRAK